MNVLKTALTRLVSYLIVLYYFSFRMSIYLVLVNSKPAQTSMPVWTRSISVVINLPCHRSPQHSCYIISTISYLHWTMTKYTLSLGRHCALFLSPQLNKYNSMELYITNIKCCCHNGRPYIACFISYPAAITSCTETDLNTTVPEGNIAICY